MSVGETWQVSVTGLNSEMYTITVAENGLEFRRTKVSEFRAIVHKEWPHLYRPIDDFRLYYAGKQLQDTLPNGKKATLGDYKMHQNALIQLVLRLSGGEDTQYLLKLKEKVPKPRVTEKKHTDRSLKYTTKECDAFDPFGDEDAQPRVIMSCGHAVDANTLTQYCHSQIDQFKSEFRCPAVIDQAKNTLCNKIWSYEEVRRAAHLTKAEQKYFEGILSWNATPKLCDAKECPGCRSLVDRRDLNNLRVHCHNCTKRKQRNYDFCWHCRREWTGPTTSSTKCGNINCEHPDMPSIRDAPIVSCYGSQFPSRRACPTCGVVVEHKLTLCKFVICPRCKDEFCFLCLELKDPCLKTSSYKGPCSKDPAPKQTHIPIWSKQKELGQPALNQGLQPYLEEELAGEEEEGEEDEYKTTECKDKCILL